MDDWLYRVRDCPSKYKIIAGDRFIPNRSLMDMSHAKVLLNSKTVQKDPDSPFNYLYRKKIEEKLTLDSEGRPFRKMVFRGTPTSNTRSLRYVSDSELQYEQDFLNDFKRFQLLPKKAEMILNAPDIQKDIYLNLIDWGKNNRVAVGLGSSVYMLNGESDKSKTLMNIDDMHDYPTSVAWSPNGKKTLAVGLNLSTIQIWDVERSRLVRTLDGHGKRVGCLAWNGNILTSGSDDSLIIIHDERMRRSSVSHLRAHTGEVYGLKWSETGGQLASSGNDSVIHIWEATQTEKFSQRLTEHQDTVKAIAWCPHQFDRLASGGSTADRCIKLWNTQAGKCLRSIDTESQVSALEWNMHHKEMLSGHGVSSYPFSLSLWKYPSLSNAGVLRAGHPARILCLSQSPDGLTVVAAGEDETIRFWKIFEPPEARPAEVESLLSLERFHIR